MRVDLATQVLSNSISKAITLLLGDEATETAKFAEMFDKFFDCLNASNFSVGKQQRNVFKNPYYSAEDFRLTWLEKDMLSYLNNWELSVQEREGYKEYKLEQQRMLLSHETRLGCKLSAKSFVELVKYLFTVPSVNAFMSNRICQDPVENFFSQQRQRGKANENPNMHEFLKNTQALRVINSTCAAIRGNCRGGSTNKFTLEENCEPLPKRARRSL